MPGVIYADLAMMTGVDTSCENCEGMRFHASVLDHYLGARDISDVLVSDGPAHITMRHRPTAALGCATNRDLDERTQPMETAAQIQ